MSRKIYIMPAGSIGVVAYYVLKDNIRLISNNGDEIITGFIDNVKGKEDGSEFCGLPIITPEKAEMDAIVIIASFRYGKKFIKQIKRLGITNIIESECFMTKENATIALDKLKDDNIEQKYGMSSLQSQINSYFIDNGAAKNSFTVSKIDFVITQRCTLKCRDCAALMQYYSNPVDLDINTVIKSVDKIFEHIDFVRTVNILGGEPLITKQLSFLLNKLTEYRSRMGELTIITNGTIIPNNDVIMHMKQANVFVKISDYGSLSLNKNKLVDKLHSAHVRCEIKQNIQWFAMHSFSEVIRPPEEVFRSCDSYCIQVMNGKLYFCNFIANGDTLRGFPHSEDNYIDLTSTQTTKESIKAYIERNHSLPACGHCTGRNLSRDPIPVAVQIKNPLPYKLYDM